MKFQELSKQASALLSSRYRLTRQMLLRSVMFTGMLLPMSGLAAQENSDPPISLPLAVQHFELANQLVERDGGKLWGHSLAGPLILVDPATRFAVANQPDADGKFLQQGQVWTTILDEQTVVANHSAKLSGTLWTMLLWDALPLSVHDRSRLLMHESFHRLQIELDLPQHSPTNAHLETMDGRIWLRMELRALQKAMLEKGSQQKQAAIDAMSFRKFRQKLCGAVASTEEMALESNEGLAEYTGFRLCGVPETEINSQIAVALQTQENKTQYARSFAYATGPAIFRLLDQFHPRWQTEKAQFDQAADLLATHLNVSIPSLEQATELAERYRLAEVQLYEQIRFDRQQLELKRIQALFEDGPILKIETTSAFQFSFDPNQSTPLDNNRNIFRPFKASDAWGTILAPDGAMLSFDAPMSVTVPYSDSKTWELQLNPEYEWFQQEENVWKVRKKK